MVQASREGELQAWLQRGDWPRLQAHFGEREPSTALEYAAHALLLTRAQRTPERGARIVADWRHACRLQPGNLLHFVNLAQALIDAGESAEACTLAAGLVRRAPQAYPALEKLCLALQAAGRWSEAADAGDRAAQLAATAGAGLPEPMQAARAALASRWWEPQPIGGATLRLPLSDDLPFVRTAFNDTAFMPRFHRYQRGEEPAVREFVERAQRPPRETRRRDWIVVDRAGRAAGLVSIVDIDFLNRRGELLVGVPDTDYRSGAEALALKASIGAIAFAFDRLQLDKLVSYVYGDNPVAQANTLHLGFTREGLLRSHLADGDQRIDLHVNGLLRSEFDADARLQRMRRRWTST
ncbi:GNAT family N-acetyltransferase [Aquincola sp. S2]|uniref:GNAT family N-acetyltransferase n=1 Tax=Pseudaquabacterium terrae TaxID=2732868 RepID=A0ABX2ENX2_9BURK|nr:GNAT family protein [Aquabacterium terrae]NRF70351.1 GNAT family N-acetyltransferase [Aquabacterium terrae]